MKTRVDDDRELAGEDREDLRRHLAAHLRERNLLAPLPDPGDDDVLPPELSESQLFRVGDESALLDRPRAVATLPGVARHVSSSCRRRPPSWGRSLRRPG